MPLSGDVVAVERVWRRLYSHSEELLTYLLAQSRRLRGRRYHAGVVIRSRANEVVYVADINPSDGVGGRDSAGRAPATRPLVARSVISIHDVIVTSRCR